MKYPDNFQNIKKQYAEHNELFDNLERGTAVLQTNDELNQYLYSYGNMHEAKLEEVYAELFDELCLNNDTKIEIIDYACGQGLASIVLLNFIKNKLDITYDIVNVRRITLIEPSEVALLRAKSLLESSASLKCINKFFDELQPDDLKTDFENIKIHLFSNILDMSGTHFDAESLSDLIINTQNGLNYFICVSALEKNKLAEFQSMFKNQNGFSEIATFNGFFNNDSKWKIKFHIFKMG